MPRAVVEMDYRYLREVLAKHADGDAVPPSARVVSVQPDAMREVISVVLESEDYLPCPGFACGLSLPVVARIPRYTA